MIDPRTTEGFAPDAEVLVTPDVQELASIYLPAIEAFFLQSKRGTDQHDPLDLAHEFFLQKVVEERIMDKVRGKTLESIRAYLGRSLKNFRTDKFRAQVRDRELFSRGTSVNDAVEAIRGRINPRNDPSEAFDREWAVQVFDEGLSRTEAQLRASGKGDLWELFHDRVLIPASNGSKPLRLTAPDGQKTYEKVREVRNYVRSTIRAIVTSHSPSASDAEEEMLYFKKVLGTY